MIDHISLGAEDIQKAADFYTPVLAAIGAECLGQSDEFVGYGRGRFEFAIMLPFNKEAASHGNGTHIAFHARNNEEVDAFYAAALENGGSCDGAPGPRAYPHAEVYACYVRDPDGNKIEALAGGFSGVIIRLAQAGPKRAARLAFTPSRRRAASSNYFVTASRSNNFFFVSTPQQ